MARHEYIDTICDFGQDDSARAPEVRDIFDADRDSCSNGLLHGKRVYHFGAVEGQLSSFGRGNCRQ